MKNKLDLWTTEDIIKTIVMLSIDGKTLKETARELGRTEIALEKKWKRIRGKYGVPIKPSKNSDTPANSTIDDIVKSVKALPVIIKPSVFHKDKTKDTEIAKINISDMHVGQLASKEHTGGLGEYNWQTTLERVDLFKKATMKHINLRRKSTNIPNLVVCLLGDIIEGHGIFKTQPYETEFDITIQIERAIDLISELLLFYAQYFEEVTVVGVPGNHGVLNGRKNTPNHINFDTLVYRLVKKRLCNQKSIHFNFSETWFQVINILGWKFCLIHGDDIGGSVMSESKVERVWTKYQKMLNEIFTYMDIGHFHSSWLIPYGVGCMHINGGWCGANAFTKVIKNASVPTQWLQFIHKNWGVSVPIPIYLVTKEGRVPDIKTIKM